MGHNYKLIGAPCAHRGSYTFYKAFKYTKNDITSILAINEFFFVKLWNDSDLISIGELRLLWEDKTCNLALASLRLYILPENTPEGRMGDVHGADEVLAITEKVVIKVEDLLTWITEATNWTWGLDSVWRNDNSPNSNVPSFNGRPNINGDSNATKSPRSISENKLTLVDCSAIDYSDILDEKRQLDKMNWDKRTGVTVLSYARYCRYRALLKRLEGVHDEWLRNSLVQALGGFYTTCKTTKILFCKDTFDYPELEGHELLCNHLAPKLRSRLPKRKKTLYPSPDVSETDSTSNSCSADEDERIPSSASSTNSRISVAASRPTPVQKKPPSLLPLPIDDSIQITAVDELKKQKAFTQNLGAFMRAQMTPIAKLPIVGSKELNLFEFYNTVKVLGGYGAVCANKLWKFLFEKMGGDGNSNGAVVLKKHYEKYLLPYERHLAQQFKQSNNNQILVRQQPAEVRKSQPTNSAAEYERRRLMASAAAAKSSLIQRMLPNGKPGDKENIPMSQRRLMMARAEVINVRETDAGNPTRSGPGAHQQRPGSSTTEPEVIDLCVDTPIKRSVPSIAATLSSKRRKLDILREGGLEVTPISSSFGSAVEPDVVTITKTISIDTDGGGGGGGGGARGSPYESSSIEILDPRKYTSSSEPSPPANHYRPKTGQLLDLSVFRGGYNGMTDDNLIKKITPSLGPNIEISIVPSDEAQRDQKKRKSMQLPVPALRKISTGELTVRNLSMKANEPSRNNRGRMPTTMAAPPGRKFESNLPFARDLRPSVSITATDKAPSYPAPHMGLPMNMNHSVYLAALYNGMLPAAQPNEYFNEDMMAASTYQHPLSFLAGSFLQQQQQHYQQQGSSRNTLRHNDQMD